MEWQRGEWRGLLLSRSLMGPRRSVFAKKGNGLFGQADATGEIENDDTKESLLDTAR